MGILNISSVPSVESPTSTIATNLGSMNVDLPMKRKHNMKSFGFKHNTKTEKYELYEEDGHAALAGMHKIKRIVAEFDWWDEAMICCKALNDKENE